MCTMGVVTRVSHILKYSNVIMLIHTSTLLLNLVTIRAFWFFYYFLINEILNF